MRIEVGQSPYGADLHLRLPGGDAGVMATLQAMAALVDDAVEHSPRLAAAAQKLGELARSMTRNTTPTMKSARAVYRFLKRNVKFIPDPVGLEHLRHPDQLLFEINHCGSAKGDCDEVATLGAALLKKMGVNACFIVAGRQKDGRFEHVLYGVRDVASGRFYPIDSQHRMIGKLPSKVKRVKSFAV